MDNLNGYINFWPEYIENMKISENDICIVYCEKQILVKKDKEKITFPLYKECKNIIATEKMWYLGKWLNVPCFAYEKTDMSLDGLDIDEMEWIGFRDKRWPQNREMYNIAVKSQHLLGWDKSTAYCGYCGSKNQRAKEERAKICPHCKKIVFPRISPAIIVGITKGDKLLLAHNSGFREGLYSIIAGFVEQGENLETAVRREVYEEVGIKIKNIKYDRSSPWNSQDSLMLGFTAEYDEGEIKVDGKEIVDAGWYSKDYLPFDLPDKISTARGIIDKLFGLND